MKKAALLISSLFVTSNLYAYDNVLNGYSGKESGAYHRMVTTMLVQLPRSLKRENVNTAGSGEILDRINSDISGFGFAQSDAVSQYIKANPNHNLEVLAKVLPECIYVVVNKNSNIESEDDLTGKIISVGGVGSGAEISLSNMKLLDPDSYSSIEKVNIEPIISLSKLSSQTSNIDAFMFVAYPSVENPYIKIVNDKKDNLKLIGIDDYSMNDKLPNGESVYEFKNVNIKNGFFSNTIKTACTSALLVSNTNNPYNEKLANITLTNSASIENAANR